MYVVDSFASIVVSRNADTWDMFAQADDDGPGGLLRTPASLSFTHRNTTWIPAHHPLPHLTYDPALRKGFGNLGQCIFYLNSSWSCFPFYLCTRFVLQL
ncbi:hypothetical protein Zmor_003366 [Zophobas morio]|uniref:Uncharacterized protein n=1 Tax=Zophobas morio TaxID=2755281 RepID=A0AA38HMZ0_9CUCU|nr:hypothetical protein Zmor_003366 [Zophobas morio]